MRVRSVSQPVEAKVVEQSEPSEPIEASVEAVSVAEPDVDAIDISELNSAAIVDTTAELLGRATSKRPRSRAPAPRHA